MVSLALFAFAASAQMLEPDLCMRSLGVASGITFSARDWDLTTPDRMAYTASPSLWQGCQEDARWNWVTWFGVTAMPVYQHSYGGALDQRLPLLGLITWGAGNEISYRTMIGAELATNGIAFGGGLRINTSFKPGIAMRPGPDLRVRLLWGSDPELQVELLWRFAAHQTVMIPDREHPPWLVGELTYLQAGFEVGSMLGLRARLGNADRGFGLRVGIRTALNREIALQPAALAFFETPIGRPRLVSSAGVTLVDGEPRPLGGIAIGTGGKLFRGHAGVLVSGDLPSGAPDGEPPSVVPDVGLSWVW
jgi:hypothetical protein